MTEPTRQPSIAQRLIPGLGWRGLLMIGGVVGGVVGTAAVARMVSQDVFAMYLVANTAFMITPLVAELGLSKNSIRHIATLNASDRHDEALSYSRSVVTACALVTPFTCLVAATLVLVSGPESPVAVVLCLWVSLMLETVRLAVGNVLLGHERQGWAAFATYQPRVVITAAAFGLLAVAGASLDLVQILLVILATQVVLTVATLPPLRTYYAVRPAPDLPFRQLVQEGLPFLGFDLGNFVLARSDIWIAAAVLVTASERAGYGAASTLASQLVLPMVIPMLVASPIVRSLWVERRTVELTNLVRGVASLASIVALVAFGALAVFGSQVLGFIYGAEFSSASGWLAILMVGSFVVVYTGASGHVHIMCVGPRQACVVNLFWAAIGVVAMWTGASQWGATGLAVTSTATIAGLNITQVILVWRQTGIMTLPTLRPGPAIRSLRGERDVLNAFEAATPEVPIDSR